MLVEELGGDDQVGGDELAVGPQLGLVEQHVAAALLDEAGRPRLGHPRPVEGAGLERGERVGVVLRRDAHVAAAAGVGLEALLGEPRPQGDVLGVAERRRRQRRAGEVVGRVDALAHDERGAARRRAGDDAQRLAVGLGVAVDRRVGADEAGVEGAGEHRLDDLGAGVERRRLELDAVAERLGEEAGLDADDRRGVGDVREVAEPQRRPARRRRRLRHAGVVVVTAARHGGEGEAASDECEPESR